MSGYALFTDVSVSPRLAMGVGACLLLPFPLPDFSPGCHGPMAPASLLRYRYFRETTCSRLELQTLLWGVALFRQQYPECAQCSLRLYTDSAAIVGLPGRRERLERMGFRSGRSNCELANGDLYREFYAASDGLDFTLIKVAGHAPAQQRDGVEQLFSLVDRGARRELRLWLERHGDRAT